MVDNFVTNKYALDAVLFSDGGPAKSFVNNVENLFAKVAAA